MAEYLAGPCVLLIDSGATTTALYSQGDVTVSPDRKTFGVPMAGVGGNDHERNDTVAMRIEFAPDGRVTDALLTLYYAAMALEPGAMLFNNASPVQLRVIASNGRQLTFHNVALSAPPNLTFGHNKLAFDKLTFIALPVQVAVSATGNYLAASAGDLYEVGSVSFPGYDDYDQADVVTKAPLCTWGGSGNWASFYTMNGISIRPTVNFNPIMHDAYGISNYMVAGHAVEARLTPAPNITLADVTTALGLTTPTIGGPVRSTNALTGTATGLYFSIPHASLREMSETFGSNINMGELTFYAARKLTAGVYSPALTVLTAAP